MGRVPVFSPGCLLCAAHPKTEDDAWCPSVGFPHLSKYPGNEFHSDVCRCSETGDHGGNARGPWNCEHQALGGRKWECPSDMGQGFPNVGNPHYKYMCRYSSIEPFCIEQESFLANSKKPCRFDGCPFGFQSPGLEMNEGNIGDVCRNAMKAGYKEGFTCPASCVPHNNGISPPYCKMRGSDKTPCRAQRLPFDPMSSLVSYEDDGNCGP